MASKKKAAKNTSAPAKTGKVSKGSDDDKIFALLGTALPLIGYIIILLAKKNTPYATFHGKQGVVLFVAWVIASIAGLILALIPVLGWIMSTVLWIGLLVLWVLGIINALSGKTQDLPVIGVYAGKF